MHNAFLVAKTSGFTEPLAHTLQLGLKVRTYPHISIRSAGSTSQPIGSNTIKQAD